VLIESTTVLADPPTQATINQYTTLLSRVRTSNMDQAQNTGITSADATSVTYSNALQQGVWNMFQGSNSFKVPPPGPNPLFSIPPPPIVGVNRNICPGLPGPGLSINQQPAGGSTHTQSGVHMNTSNQAAQLQNQCTAQQSAQLDTDLQCAQQLGFTPVQYKALQALIQKTAKEMEQFPASSPMANPNSTVIHAAYTQLSIPSTIPQSSSGNQSCYGIRLVPIIQLLDPQNPVIFGSANLFDFQRAQAQENGQPNSSYNTVKIVSKNARISGKKRRFNCFFHETNDHYAVACPMTIQEKIQWLENQYLCTRCCRKGHTQENCPSTKMCLNCRHRGIESIHSIFVCPLRLHRRFRKPRLSAVSTTVPSGEPQVQNKRQSKRCWTIPEVQENLFPAVKRQKH